MGLGDVVETVIHTVVPDAIIESVQGKEGGCGCSKRKKKLNDFSYSLSKALSFNQKQATTMKTKEELNEMTLAELRIEYPELKAASKKVMLEKIAELPVIEVKDVDENADFINIEDLPDYIKHISKSNSKVLLKCESYEKAGEIFKGLVQEVFPELGVTVLANTSRRDVSLNGTCYLRLAGIENHSVVATTVRYTVLKDLV